MELNTKKFCQGFLKKLKNLESDPFKTEDIFNYIHELNGVALTYGFEQVGYVTAAAHDLIFEMKEQNFPWSDEVRQAYKSYFEMLGVVFEEGQENHINTKEALHLLDDFKFHLGQITEKDVA